LAKTPIKEMERVVEPGTTAAKRSSTIKSPDRRPTASLNDSVDIEQDYVPRTVAQVKQSWLRTKAVRYTIYVTIAVLIVAALIAIGAGG